MFASSCVRATDGRRRRCTSDARSACKPTSRAWPRPRRRRRGLCHDGDRRECDARARGIRRDCGRLAGTRPTSYPLTGSSAPEALAAHRVDRAHARGAYGGEEAAEEPHHDGEHADELLDPLFGEPRGAGVVVHVEEDACSRITERPGEAVAPGPRGSVALTRTSAALPRAMAWAQSSRVNADTSGFARSHAEISRSRSSSSTPSGRRRRERAERARPRCGRARRPSREPRDVGDERRLLVVRRGLRRTDALVCS